MTWRFKELICVGMLGLSSLTGTAMGDLIVSGADATVNSTNGGYTLPAGQSPVYDTMTVTGGSLLILGTLQVDNQTTVQTDATMMVQGTIDGNSTGSSAQGNLQATGGSIFVTGTVRDIQQMTLDNSASLYLSSTGALSSQQSSFDTATLEHDATGTMALGTTTLTNATVKLHAETSTTNLTATDSTTTVSRTLTNTGDLTVYGGHLTVTDTGTLSTTGTLKFNSQSTFTSAGSIQSHLTIGSGAVFQPGQSIGSTTINGTVTCDPGSQTIIELSRAANDQIQCTDAQLDGGELRVSVDYTAGPVTDNSTRSILTATGTVTGQFDNITVNNTNILSFTADYQSQTVELIAHRTSYSSFGNNDIQRAMALALDRSVDSATGDLATLLATMDQASAGDLQQTLAAMTPELYAVGAQASLDNQRLIQQFTARRLRQARFALPAVSGMFDFADSFTGRLAQISPVMADYNTTDTPIVDEIPMGMDPTYDPAMLDVGKPRMDLYANVLGSFGEQASTSARSGYQQQNVIVLVGADYILTPNLILGGYAGYAYNHVAMNDNRGKMDINGGRFGAYGSWCMTNAFVDLSVGGGLSHYNSSRTIQSNLTDQTASSDHLGYDLGLDLRTGFDFNFRQWTLTPILGFSYGLAHQPGLTEDGASLAVNADSYTRQSLQTTLGGRVGYQWYLPINWMVLPEISAGWQYELLDGGKFTGRLNANADGNFAVDMPANPSNSGYLGVGVSLLAGPNWTAQIRYDARFAENLLDHQLQIGVNYLF